MTILGIMSRKQTLSERDEEVGVVQDVIFSSQSFSVCVDPPWRNW